MSLLGKTILGTYLISIVALTVLIYLAPEEPEDGQWG